MKEARIILPRDGGISGDVMQRIARTFGGFTAYPGHGSWTEAGKLQEEQVWVVDIAYKQTTDQDEALFHLAQNMRELYKQHSVYIRYPNGHVQLVDKTSLMDRGEEPEAITPEYFNAIDAVNALSDDGLTSAERLNAFRNLYMFASTEYQRAFWGELDKVDALNEADLLPGEGDRAIQKVDA